MIGNNLKLNYKRIGDFVSDGYKNIKKGLVIAPGILGKVSRVLHDGIELLPKEKQARLHNDVTKIYDKSNKTINKLNDISKFVDRTVSLF